MSAQPERLRVVVELSDDVDALLEHVSKVLRVPRAQIAARALHDALPALVEHANRLHALAEGTRQPVFKPEPMPSKQSAPMDVLDGYISEIAGGSNA